MPAIRAAELEGFLTSDEKAPTKTVTSKDDKGQDVVLHNPAYSQWVARDQAVLGYILSSLSRETLVLVATCICAADVWSELSKFYSSQVRARTVNMRIALTTTKKNQLSIAEFYGKMRSLADDMASIGTPLRDDELVSYILAGLDEDYNSVYSAVVPVLNPSLRVSCMPNFWASNNTCSFSRAVPPASNLWQIRPPRVAACLGAALMGISLCTWSLWGVVFLSILDCF
jgi:hypothetical protein